MIRCKDCGAVSEDDRDCETVFRDFLVLEFTDPKYGAVHLLTVACFMIQHRKYSHEALIWIERRLREYLEEGNTAEQIGRQALREVRPDKRSWKVTRRPEDPEQEIIRWTMTISDVAQRFHSPESYRELIVQWAETTLRDMQPLLIEADANRKE